MFSLTVTRLLTASIIAAFIGLGSYFLQVGEPAETSIALAPASATRSAGELVVVEVVVTSDTPVNAFAGNLTFDHTLLSVERIDYNQSIADLWAEAPWYENGDGTVSFAGGTTKPGGFTGSGALITITFKTKGAGAGAVEITHAQILKHDGLGTDASIEAPIDALFTVTGDVANNQLGKQHTTAVAVASEGKSLDVNRDGTQSIGDASVFLQDLVTGDTRSDFNGDGTVSIADFSILLDTL